jgi:hypothetical protein
LPDRDQEGLPLSGAIRRFADPDKWRRYDQAATAARGRVRTRLMYVGGEPIAGWGAAEQARHDNHLLDRRDQAWRELQQDFLGRLRSGELVATGYEEPLSLGIERRPVPADVWRSLRPNFKNSTATGAGLKLTGILVHTAEDAPAPVSSTDQISEAGAIEGEPEPTFEVRPPGRPSRMREIEAEMRRRATAGQLLGSLRAESEALAHWARTTQRGERAPQPKSIAKQLGGRYRELKTKQGATKGR